MGYLVAVSLLNWSLGFVTALVMAGAMPRALPALRLPRLPRLRRTAPKRKGTQIDPPPAAPRQVDDLVTPLADETRVEIPTPTRTEEVPREWLELLDEATCSNTFVEAAVHVLRLEVGRYRDQLIAIEQQARLPETAEDADRVGACLRTLRTANAEWIARQADATRHLRARQEELGGMQAVGQHLETILLEQQSQIETTSSNLEHLDYPSHPASGCARVLRELGRLIDLSHALRDSMQESLACIARAESRLDSLDDRLRVDVASELPNRVGLEAICHAWWDNDPTRQRQLSVALIDIDRFSRINETHGTLAGDRLITAMVTSLNGMLRKTRGFDRLGRYGGERTLIVFGDTGPREATSAVERMRQSIVATSFMLGEREVAMTIRGAVTEARADDTFETLIARLNLGLVAAGLVGGNQTFLDEGQGPEAVTPPVYEVRGHLVRIAEP